MCCLYVDVSAIQCSMLILLDGLHPYNSEMLQSAAIQLRTY